MELEYNNDVPSGAEEMLNAIRDREKTYKEEDLASDLNWLEASGKIYQMNNDGEKFTGDRKALAKYGIDQMSEFNYNVSLGTIPDVMKVEKADHDTQVAFAYMMDTYDKKDITLDGVGRALKETMTDPLTYVGISTLGAGLAVKKGAEYVAKEGFKNRLHGAIRSYLTSGLAVGATEGALYTAGDEVARESVYQDADLMGGYSAGNIAASGAIGAVAGAGLVKGIEVAGKGIGKGIDYVRKQGEEAMAQVAGGGTPPKMTVPEKAKEIKERLGLKHFSVYEGDKDVSITMFEVPKEIRKQGVGSQAMEELVQSADENGKRIVLTTGLRDELHGTTSKARLVKFYKRFGFVENKGKNKDWSISENMYREPQGATK